MNDGIYPTNDGIDPTNDGIDATNDGIDPGFAHLLVETRYCT